MLNKNRLNFYISIMRPLEKLTKLSDLPIIRKEYHICLSPNLEPIYFIASSVYEYIIPPQGENVSSLK